MELARLRYAALPSIALAVMLVSCGPEAGASANTSSADATAAPDHNWISRDGFEYAYPTALTDDDKKAGKAAADVLMFRYLGVQNGVYSVESFDGGEKHLATCTNPCTVIKMVNSSYYGASEQHVVFNPESVIGAVFEDALNSQLEVYQLSTAEQQQAALNARATAPFNSPAAAANTASNDASQTAPMADPNRETMSPTPEN